MGAKSECMSMLGFQNRQEHQSDSNSRVKAEFKVSSERFQDLRKNSPALREILKLMAGPH